MGSFAPTRLGLFDLCGNLTEWCQDWHGARYYDVSPARDPHGPKEGTQRILRGGSFDSPRGRSTSSARGQHRSNFHGEAVGFRCAVDLPH